MANKIPNKKMIMLGAMIAGIAGLTYAVMQISQISNLDDLFDVDLSEDN